MIFIADTHEDVSHINQFKSFKDLNIIHLGDIMTYYDSYNMRLLNDSFVIKNIKMYVLRGNHDEPSYFDGQHDLSNIKYLPDYTVLNIEGKNVLFVGGAISIDRKQRNEHHPFILDKKKLAKLPKIDIIASHAAPWYSEPINYSDIVNYFRKFDFYLDRDIKKERRDLATLVEEVSKKGKPILFIYGHYHKHFLTLVDGIEYRCVGVEEFFEL